MMIPMNGRGFEIEEAVLPEGACRDLAEALIPPPWGRTLDVKLARLEGYLDRKGDSPPGNTFVWRGSVD